jgi:uncharacterized membrane protein
MKENKSDKNIHSIFVASVTVKALNAILEITLGILFLFSGTITNFILFLTQNELIEDPTSFFASHINGLIPKLTVDIQIFGAIYLILHGLIKLLLSYGLLKKRTWAHPAAMVFLVLFIVYQMYSYLNNHVFLLIVLSSFDLLVLILVWREYDLLKKLKAGE